jgi:hypothetical protein
VLVSLLLLPLQLVTYCGVRVTEYLQTTVAGIPVAMVVFAVAIIFFSISSVYIAAVAGVRVWLALIPLLWLTD